MKQINRVKWYKTTEKKPNRDCEVVLLNSAVEDVIIYFMNFSAHFRKLNCSSDSNETAIELTDFEYWCYADDFYKQFERTGIYAE